MLIYLEYQNGKHFAHLTLLIYEFWFYWMFYEHFLHTHSWLYWVDEDDWLIRPEAPGVRAKELDPNFAIIGTTDSGKVQVRQAWGHLAGVWKCPG